MNYRFAELLLMRAPAGTGYYKREGTQFFLDNEFFRSAVLLASPTFFNRIQQRAFNFEALNEKERFTLQKYINRYCFRPTPFGLFASVSLFGWGTDNKFSPTGEKEFSVILRADQVYQMMLSRNLLADQPVATIRYVSNPSLYRMMNEFRFIRSETDAGAQEREYLLQSIPYSNWLNRLILFCRRPRTADETSAYIAKVTGSTLEEAKDYLNFLTDAQFLVNELHANITGVDYLTRVAGILQKNQQVVTGMNSVLQQLSGEHLIKTAYFKHLNDELRRVLYTHPPDMSINQLSVILHRNSGKEEISINYQSIINDAIFALDVLVPETRIPAIEQFIKHFRQHFEGQTVPLLKVLDPDTGIGYQTDGTEKDYLLETLHIPSQLSHEQVIAWSAVHSCLLNSWHRERNDRKPVIRLSGSDLKMLRPPGARPITGMSVLFRLINDQVYIESAGGINAPALLGRFTIGSEPVTKMARKMARLQEEQNPGVIFAELLHLTDPHIDNINRRESLWSYELPITATSLHPPEHQLALSDLYIRLHGNRVLLYSAKHRKPVIPKLTSAYNFNLDRLPLFRFLAALPYQYGRHEFSFDLSQYFPDLNFYPRVEYQSAILSLATWIINEEQLSGIRQPSDEMIIKAFRDLSQQLQLPEKFSLAEGDQQLVFNQQREEDILFFANCVRQKTKAVLKEFLDQPDIRQFNTFLLPSEPLDLESPPFISEKGDIKQPKRQFIPGSEWLYLKIYTPSGRATALLLSLRPLLGKRYKNGPIKRWFFIRYDDHAPHIRLRLQIDPEATNEILLAFKTKLEYPIQQHVVREYQLDVYNRELERYMIGGMDLTENFFWRSSELVLHFMNRVDSGTTYYLFALQSIMCMIKKFIPVSAKQLEFVYESYEQFLPEFKKGRLHVELDKKYRALQKDIRIAMTAEAADLSSGSLKAANNFRKSVNKLFQQTARRDEGMLSYLRSIIHMHLNRIFTGEPRKQEMIIYYLLYKFLQTEKFRSRH